MKIPPWLDRIDALLTKTGFGLYVEGGDLYMCRAQLGARGPRVDVSTVVPLTAEPLGRQVGGFIRGVQSAAPQTAPVSASPFVRAAQRLLRPVLDMLRRMPPILEVGFSEKAVFYSIFPVSSPIDRKEGVDGIVNQNPRAYFLSGDDMSVDWLDCKIKENNFVVMGGMRRQLADSVLQELYAANLHPIRMEAGPWAALRVAWHHLPPSSASGQELEIRILRGPRQTLVALCLGSTPLGWQVLPAPDPGADAAVANKELFTAIKRFTLHSRQSLQAPVKRLRVQGAPAPKELAKEIEDRVRIPAQAADCPPFDGGMIAYGLAMGALRPDTPGINMARAIQKPVPLLAIFPRMDTLVACLAVGFVLVTLGLRVQALSGRLANLKAENGRESWARFHDNHELDDMNQKLLKEAQPLSQYMADRMYWAPLLEEIEGLLPPRTFLTRLRLSDGIWSKSGERDLGERFMVMTFVARYPSSGGVPQELDQFLEALHGSDIFMRALPNIRIKAIDRREIIGGDIALVTLLCTPAKLRTLEQTGGGK